MTYALTILIAARELYRHIAKIGGWKPRSGTLRTHVINVILASGVLLAGFGGLVAWHPLSVIGWCAVGIAAIATTTAPCSLRTVNEHAALWYPRQLFFLAMGVGIIAYALGVL